MYADLLARVADDVEAGGSASVVLEGYNQAPGPSAVGLRLMGSVHRLVVERRAGLLAAYYPSVGGIYEPDGCWTAFRELLSAQPDAVREWLDRPPQTNEVGRAAALMGGLCSLGPVGSSLPVRLFEIGSSAGLNLLVDRFDFVADAWQGVVPSGPPPVIVERLGCDLMPIDPRTTDGRLALTAYVWADQSERHERLRAALACAAEVDVEVRAQGAASFVSTLSVVTGTLTVLWHSVMWQYLDRTEQREVDAQIDRLAASATDEAPFAHLRMEPTRRTGGADHEFLVVLDEWPGGVRRILGVASAHGTPITWE
ncbi:DUF2332 domain-containing protein [Nocardioides salsibiostraticola]